MTELSKSGSAFRRLVMSWQTVNLCCFWYLERIFGTIFAHNLCISKFSVRIFHCVSAKEKFLRNHSHSQSTNYTHQLLHLINAAISPACNWSARSLIVLTFFSTFLELLVIQKHKLLPLFLLCKLAVATQNILKVSYQAWLTINSLLHSTHVCRAFSLTLPTMKPKKCSVSSSRMKLKKHEANEKRRFNQNQREMNSFHLATVLMSDTML